MLENKLERKASNRKKEIDDLIKCERKNSTKASSSTVTSLINGFNHMLLYDFVPNEKIYIKDKNHIQTTINKFKKNPNNTVIVTGKSMNKI